MEDNRNYVEVLVNTLQKQTEVLKEILLVTKQQSQIADDEEFKEGMLEESLNQKEILIAQLNALDNGFGSVYEHVRKEVIENKEAYQKELADIQALIKECTDLGVEIQVLEQRNKEKLTRCFAKRHQEYNMAKTATQVASNYHKTMSNTKILDSYFLDKKK